MDNRQIHFHQNLVFLLNFHCFDFYFVSLEHLCLVDLNRFESFYLFSFVLFLLNFDFLVVTRFGFDHFVEFEFFLNSDFHCPFFWLLHQVFVYLLNFDLIVSEIVALCPCFVLSVNFDVVGNLFDLIENELAAFLEAVVAVVDKNSE